MTKIVELMYNDFNAILETEAVTAAEAEFKSCYDRLKKLDNDLAMAVDEAVGMIARAYEKNGFCGGYEFGKVASA